MEGIEEELIILKKIFQNQKEFKIVGCENDGRRGLELINKLEPDLIITDSFVDTVDGIGVITALRHRSRSCKIILRLTYNISAAITMATNAGVDYIVPKNIDTMVFLKHCIHIFDTEQIFRRCNDTIKYIIKNVLDQTGLSPTHIGYGYLMEAIIICYENPSCLLSKNSVLYPMIAKHHNVRDETIERAIRTAIAYAWKKYNGNHFYKRVKCEGAHDNKKPNCSEFIYAVYSYLISPEIYLGQ